MTDALLDRLSPLLGERLRPNEALAAHTTMRVGGPAAAFVRAESVDDIRAVAQACRDVERPWLMLGRGSNLVVADAGWPGVVLTLGRSFRGVEVEGEGVTAGAAEPMPVLANAVARHGLGGLAFGVAIPGTLGGAVRMNAGAHGRELVEVLESADVLRLSGELPVQCLTRAELGMSYRHTQLPADAVVLRARLRLQRADPDELGAQMAEMRRWRREHQPINEPSCGSVFRNPPGDSAGRLVEACGLKGHRVGRAYVSEKHANFITAEPGASAADIYAIIRHVQSEVQRCAGVRLHTEVVLVGFSDGPAVPERGEDEARR